MDGAIQECLGTWVLCDKIMKQGKLVNNSEHGSNITNLVKIVSSVMTVRTVATIVYTLAVIQSDCCL